MVKKKPQENAADHLCRRPYIPKVFWAVFFGNRYRSVCGFHVIMLRGSCQQHISVLADNGITRLRELAAIPIAVLRSLGLPLGVAHWPMADEAKKASRAVVLWKECHN